MKDRPLPVSRKNLKKISNLFPDSRDRRSRGGWIASVNEPRRSSCSSRTLVSSLIATTVAAATLAGTVQPSAASDHHHRRELGIGIAAGVGGFVLGSLLAQQQPQPVYVDEYGGGSWHVRRCLARYASYDPGSDTYIGYDGYPHYCRL